MRGMKGIRPARHRGRFALVVALSAVLAATTACAGDGGKDKKTGSNNEKITLNVDDFGTFGYQDLYKQYMSQHPNIKINERNVPKLDDYLPRLQQWIAAGAGAGDVVAIEEGIMVKFKSQPDKFVDLKKYGAASLQGELHPLEVAGRHEPGRLQAHRARHRRRQHGTVLPPRPVQEGRPAERP